MQRTIKQNLIMLTVGLMFTRTVFGQAHFTPVEPTGLAYHIILEGLTINGKTVPAGTEIGIFDSDLCVGSAIVYAEPISSIGIVTWEGNSSYNLQGFTKGNNITFIIYTQLYQEYVELDATPVYTTGDGTFGYGSYSSVTLNANYNNAPSISISVAEINFGEVTVGESQDYLLNIRNNGTAPLLISAIQLDNNQFLTYLTVNTIPADSTVEVSVQFQPNSPSLNQAQMQIISDDPVNPIIFIPVYGQGIPTIQPSLFTSDQNIDFGSVRIGDSEARTVQLFNYGQSTLTVSNLSSSNSAFRISETQFDIAPGSSKSIEIVFKPQNTDNFSGNISISCNAVNSGYYSIYVSGKGFEGHFNPVASTGLPYVIVIQDAVVDGHALQQGDEVAVFDGQLCVGIGIYYGTMPFQITAWQSDPSNDLEGFTSGHPISLKLWALTYSQNVELDPTVNWIEGGNFGDGAFSSVSIEANSGLEPHILIQDESLQFDDTQIYSEKTLTATISNTGQSVLSISNISSSNGVFWVEPSSLNIPANSSSNITIHFNPSSPILYNGKLTIHSNDPDNELASISVTGQGLTTTSRYLYASTQSVNFGAVPNDSVVTTQINLLNTGSGPINISNISLYSEYFQIENTPASLEPGQTYPLKVSFYPNYSGYYSGQITVENNSENQPQMVIMLSGIGYDEYFTPVKPTGLPYKIIIQSIDTTADYQPKTGDEFGIFDGRLCVGSIIIDTTQQTQSGTAWENNISTGMPGFENGNQINIHYARHIGDSIASYWVDYEILEGDGNFGTDPYFVANIRLTDIPVLLYPPTGLLVIDSIQTVQIGWNSNSEENLAYYKIYRDTTDNFNVSKEALIDSTDRINTSYIDSTVENNTVYYYRISAVDNEGWESPPSACLRVRAIVVKVWDVRFLQRRDGSGIIDVYYSFSGQNTTYYKIVPELSIDGSAWSEITQIDGDAGLLVPGLQYQISWNLLTEYPFIYTTNAKFKINILHNTASGNSEPIGESDTIIINEGSER